MPNTDLATIEKEFDAWWFNEGSGMPPLPNEDAEEHVQRISRIAWLNGAFKEQDRQNRRRTLVRLWLHRQRKP